jgi:hypothetical protein
VAELHNPQRWYSKIPDGSGYIFTDPQDGDAIDPNRVPHWLLDEPELASGIDELAARGENVHVDMVYHRHIEPDDLGDVRQGWFEGRIARADFYGMEDFGTSERRRRNTLHQIEGAIANHGLKDASTGEGLIQVGEQSGIDPIELRYFRAALMGSVDFASVDIARDGTATESAIVKAYDMMDSPDLQQSDMSLDECYVADMALDNAREWIAIAKLGVELGRRMPSRKQKIDSVMTYAALHQDMDRKLRAVGPYVTSVVMRPELCLGTTDACAVISQGYITSHQLAIRKSI